jgi:hypothetical protein
MSNSAATTDSTAAVRKDFDELTLIADSTAKGAATAIKQLNRFCSLIEYPPFENWTKESLEKEENDGVQAILYRFATYLLEERSERTNQYLKPGTGLQYLSAVKMVIERKFPLLKPFQHGQTQWYEDLYGALQNKLSVAAIKRGEQIENRTVGIHRELLVRICDVLLSVGTSSALENRAVILALYHAVGRGGEVSTSNWNTAGWEVINGEGRFSLNWGETKGGKEALLPFFPDYNTSSICFLHGLASYLITTTGQCKVGEEDANVEWIFKSYSDITNGGGASTKATRILKSLIGRVTGLRDVHTVHGLRAGASDDMMLHPMANILGAIARGNWDFSGECMIFRYMLGKLHVAIPGRILAGYPNPHQEVAYPSLIPIWSEETAPLLRRMMDTLFFSFPKNLEHLLPFRDAMFASLLMYHEEMANLPGGTQKTLVTKMTMAARTVAVQHTRLCAWGRLIKSDFGKRNASHAASAVGTAEQRFEVALRGQMAENAEHRAELKSMKEEVVALRCELKELTMAMQNQNAIIQEMLLLAQEQPRPSPRRRLTSSPSVARAGDEAACSSIVVTQPSTETGPPKKKRNALDMLAAGAKTNVSNMSCTQPDEITKQTLASLLREVVIYKIDFNNVNCFGTAVSSYKQARNKAKKVYDWAIKLANEDQKAALCPSAAHTDNTDKCAQAVEKAATIEIRRLMMEKKLPKPGDKPVDLRIKNTVGSMYNVLWGKGKEDSLLTGDK